uniref:Uncharacterized protein n=1 Tax=Caenorhabditis japonica TaxID=281687 RepID=A0A8R1DTT6_CAEJA
MGDQRFRIGRENFSVSAMNGNERYLSMPFARVKPPVVNKIDGRARILRPLRQTVMQTSTTHPNQATPSTSNVSSSSESRQSSSMHHSQSMPVLQSRASNSGAKPSTASQNQTASGRSTLTFPSNTTERNLLPLLTWIEMMRQKMEKMRQKSKKALSESMRDHSTMEDLSRAREVFVEMANIYNELNRTSQIKCRMNAVFDKRAIYKATEAAINTNLIIFGLWDVSKLFCIFAAY